MRVRLEKKPSRLRSTATRPGSAPVIRVANASMKAPRSPCALRIQAALKSKASDPSLNVLFPPLNAPARDHDASTIYPSPQAQAMVVGESCTGFIGLA